MKENIWKICIKKKNEGMPKFLFPGENKFKTQSKDNNSVRRSSIWNNSLFPNGIYNEELYSYFVNAELKEQLDNQSQKYNIINSDQKINYNIFQEFLSNNIIAIYIPTRHTFQNQNEEKINQSILNQSILNQIILIFPNSYIIFVVFHCFNIEITCFNYIRIF